MDESTFSQEEKFLSHLCTQLATILQGSQKIAVAVFLMNNACYDLRRTVEEMAPELLPELDALNVAPMEDAPTGELVPVAQSVLTVLADGRLDAFGGKLMAAMANRPQLLNPVDQETGD